MILLIDHANDRTVIAAVGPKKAERVDVAGRRDLFEAIAVAGKRFGFLKKPPACIAIVLGVPGGTRDASWSSVRAAVAVGNTLAFSWGVPVAELRVQGGETLEELADMARRAAPGAKEGSWVSALYSGQPNITKPKTRL